VQCDFAARVVVELWTAPPEETLDDDADDVAELDIDLIAGLRQRESSNNPAA
jgi:hypothetical protein